MSQALIDLQISHEEFANEEENYRWLKENIGMTKSSDELNRKEPKKLK